MPPCIIIKIVYKYVFPLYNDDMKTILIVDDSKIMRNIVKNHFSELNIACQYIEAVDGADALDKLWKNPVNLVLLDWNMPNLLGIDFLKKVRSMDMYKDLPIIMVTSEAAKFNVIEALKQGATDYFVKPINAKLFKEKLSRINF